jgi:uncharacterized membrane protein YedE/YeeE
MQILVALVAGALFGAGLTVAQMVDPLKVQGFLDVAGIAKGTWDPTLLMVFVGALPVVYVAYAIQRRMRQPIVAAAFQIPTRNDIDARLVGGSALFGIGWGLAGICPGPAMTAFALAGAQITGLLVFVAAMIAGILLSRLLIPGRGDGNKSGAATSAV